MKKIAILIQGPHSKNLFGFNTIDSIRKINRLTEIRDKFYLIASIWEDEPQDIKDEIYSIVDKVVEAKKPASWGSGNRSIQVQGVAQGLVVIDENEFDYVIKTRSDIDLSEKFLKHIVLKAENNFDKLLVSNIYTRFEPFHIADLIVFSTVKNMKQYFDPSEFVYYEDLYSPEVQFARMFIRNKSLKYTMRLDDYLRFLKDWVEIADFEKYGLFWYKMPDVSVRSYNKISTIMYDRDCGPVLTKCLTERALNFIKTTKIPLSLISTYLLCADAFWRYIILSFKSFFNYHLYFVDPNGSEYSKPIFQDKKAMPKSLLIEENQIEILKSKIDFIRENYKNKKVLLYGAGKFASVIFEELDLSGINILGISDKKFMNKDLKEDFFKGYKTFSPNEIPELKPDIILITTLSARPVQHYLNQEILKRKKVKIEMISNF